MKTIEYLIKSADDLLSHGNTHQSFVRAIRLINQTTAIVKPSIEAIVLLSLVKKCQLIYDEVC